MAKHSWKYDEVKKYIEVNINESYTLLSTEYNGIHKPLKISCNKKHVFNTSFSNIKDHGNRCTECNLINKNINNYNELKVAMNKEGYELISVVEEFKTKKSILLAKCKDGHDLKTSWDKWFSKEYRCMECYKKIKTLKIYLNEDKVLNFIKLHGFSIVKWIDDCKDSHSKFITECSNGHNFETCYANLKSSNCGCMECSGNLKHEGEKVYNDFVLNGLVPQFKAGDYISARQRLPYICKIHSDLGIQYKTYSSILRSKKENKVGCPTCTRIIGYDKERMSQDYVFNFMINKGMIPLDGEKYIDNHSHIKYICNYHKEKGVQTTTWMNLNDGKGCSYCAYDSIRGENHYNYKGGITPIYNRVRDYVMKGNWRKESYAKYNGKCIITNTYGNLNVHHLNKNFSDILDEALETLDFEYGKSIKDCKEEELIKLEELVLKLHYDYGYGVPLNKTLHDLFHSIYSRISNTPEQFDEFKENYYKGIYDKDLEEELKEAI